MTINISHLSLLEVIVAVVSEGSQLLVDPGLPSTSSVPPRVSRGVRGVEHVRVWGQGGGGGRVRGPLVQQVAQVELVVQDGGADLLEDVSAALARSGR